MEILSVGVLKWKEVYTDLMKHYRFSLKAIYRIMVQSVTARQLIDSSSRSHQILKGWVFGIR